jgi:hypothetical protein
MSLRSMRRVTGGVATPARRISARHWTNIHSGSLRGYHCVARPPRRREPTREASLFCGSAVGRGTESIGLDCLAWTTTGGCGNPASCAMFGLRRRGGPLLRTDPEPGSLTGDKTFFFFLCDDDDDAFSLPIIHYSSIHPSIHLSQSLSLRLASGAPFRHRIALRIRLFAHFLILYLVRATSLQVLVAQCICIGCCDLKRKANKKGPPYPIACLHLSSFLPLLALLSS